MLNEFLDDTWIYHSNGDGNASIYRREWEQRSTLEGCIYEAFFVVGVSESLRRPWRRISLNTCDLTDVQSEAA